MTKKLLLVAVATLSLSAAHAVTINWNQDVDWGNIRWRQLSFGSEQTADIYHIGSSTKQAFRLNVRFSNGVPVSGCLLMIGGTLNGGGVGGIVLSLSEEGLIATLTDENHTATFNGSGRLETGLNQVVVVVDRGVANDYGAAISIFINGQECLTYEGRMGGVTFNRVTFGHGYEATDAPMAMDGVTWNGVVASSANADDNYTGSNDIRKAYATLPEPTVLALLALGVARVALRRKVA